MSERRVSAMVVVVLEVAAPTSLLSRRSDL
jgi:hypothetical protein